MKDLRNIGCIKSVVYYTNLMWRMEKATCWSGPPRAFVGPGTNEKLGSNDVNIKLKNHKIATPPRLFNFIKFSTQDLVTPSPRLLNLHMLWFFLLLFSSLSPPQNTLLGKCRTSQVWVLRELSLLLSLFYVYFNTCSIHSRHSFIVVSIENVRFNLKIEPPFIPNCLFESLVY